MPVVDAKQCHLVCVISVKCVWSLLISHAAHFTAELSALRHKFELLWYLDTITDICSCICLFKGSRLGRLVIWTSNER